MSSEPWSYHPSPHWNERPAGMAVELMVIHAISLPAGVFATPHIDALFCGRLTGNEHPDFPPLATLRVAAHFVIFRQGNVVQYVPVAKRAWHAGESVWQNRSNCNDFSVGVELEGDWQTPFEAVQYTTLARLYRTLQATIPTLTSYAGHQDIAPGRKWDPGPCFDWQHWQHCLTTSSPEQNWPVVWA